jgi:hypothetical protein
MNMACSYCADFLVVQKQIKELRDFEVIDRARGFTLLCNYQIRLLCFFI